MYGSYCDRAVGLLFGWSWRLLHAGVGLLSRVCVCRRVLDTVVAIVSIVVLFVMPTEDLLPNGSFLWRLWLNTARVQASRIQLTASVFPELRLGVATLLSACGFLNGDERMGERGSCLAARDGESHFSVPSPRRRCFLRIQHIDDNTRVENDPALQK